MPTHQSPHNHGGIHLPPRTDLSTFAMALATHLPGQWTSEYRQHARYEDQFSLQDEIWDVGQVQWAVSEFVLRHEAELTGPDSQRLYVIDRPLHTNQFLVAPLTPTESLEPHHFDRVEEPNGIKVSNDPLRAATAVARRVLPRYQDALIAVRHNAQVQPEPPLRPSPPEVAQVLTLTWHADGALGAPYASVPEQARTTLYSLGFQYHPHEGAFLLPPSYGSACMALRVQSASERLAAQGIGVNLRHYATAPAATRPAPATTPPVTSSSPTGLARHR